MSEKIVLNLVSNAFKFTFGGEITVSLHQAGAYVELRVRDTGIGIAPEALPHRVRALPPHPGSVDPFRRGP